MRLYYQTFERMRYKEVYSDVGYRNLGKRIKAGNYRLQ